MRRMVVWNFCGCSIKLRAKTQTPCVHSVARRFLCKQGSTSLEGLVEDDRETTSTSSSSQFSSKDLDFLKKSIRDVELEFGESSRTDDAFSIINAIKIFNDGLGEKSQKFLRQFRNKLNETLVVDVLKNVHNVELGVRFFMWAGRQIGYNHSLIVYDSLLDLLGCGGNERVADHYLREMKKDDREVLGKLLNVLIRKCCNNGMWNLALEELGRLKDFGYRPSKVTYNALVRVFIEADKLETAFLVHKEMLHEGAKMDLHTLNCFTYSLCKRGKWRDALDVIQKEEVRPDAVLYTKIIMGLCEAALFEEAMEFLDRMRLDSCAPNVITYKVLLCGCLNKGKLGRCKRILSMMIAEGCYPNRKIFNSLVHAFCKNNGHSYAYKLFKKMEDCGVKPDYVVYNILIGSICGNDDLPSRDLLELAENAYDEMLGVGIMLNRVNVSNIARCFCAYGKFEKAYAIIREMMTKGFIPDAGTYNKVIGFLLDTSKVDKAVLLFKEMKINGITPNVYTYSILIDRFCKIGLIQQARQWFDEMVRSGCTPTVVTYTSIIHSYLKSRMIGRANELFMMMLSQGCTPNVVTFSALIDGYCKAGDTEKACAIYEKMKGNTKVHDINMYFEMISDDRDKVPNVVTYGALVDGLCKLHRVKEARDLLDAMKAEGCMPNHIVYDALIDGFCKVGKLDEAQEIFSQMSEHGYNPNIYTFTSLIDRLFKEQRLDLALKILSKMLEYSISPNVIVYTVMIDGLCKTGKSSEAYRLMLMMEEKGCKPNVVTYTAMIDGFGKADQLTKSLELYQEMVNKGCAPNYVTYRVLINHCCVSGRLQEAYQFLEEMKQTHWPSHLANYHKVMEGFSKDYMLSLQLIDEISGSNSDSASILAPVYDILIESFHKAGKLAIALQLYEEYKKLPVSSFGIKKACSSLISSLLASHRVDEAFQLYADILEKGDTLEFSVLVDLIKGLLKVNRWEDALLLSESLYNMHMKSVEER